MRPPFSILVVHGDGSRVLRFRLQRWIAYGALGVTSALVTAGVCFSEAYALFKRETGELAALRRGAGDRTELAGALQRELASVRHEIASWKAAHARMWEALGREADRADGVGGPTTEPIASVGPSPWEEPDLLATSGAQERPLLPAPAPATG